ncbi:hypothetical protein L9F63_024972, partial [Diploptera punctata]
GNSSQVQQFSHKIKCFNHFFFFAFFPPIRFMNIALTFSILIRSPILSFSQIISAYQFTLDDYFSFCSSYININVDLFLNMFRNNSVLFQLF